jgi:hypothetical protein
MGSSLQLFEPLELLERLERVYAESAEAYPPIAPWKSEKTAKEFRENSCYGKSDHRGGRSWKQ